MSEKEKVWIDAIALKREAAERIYEETKDMTREEELEYWHEKDRLLRDRLGLPPAKEDAEQAESEPSTKDKVAT
jgi:hypothetical protein